MDQVEQKIGQPDDLITRRAAAELAGVDVRTVDRWANEGLITRYKLRGMQWVRFSGAEVARMRAAEIAEAVPAPGSNATCNCTGDNSIHPVGAPGCVLAD